MIRTLDISASVTYEVKSYCPINLHHVPHLEKVPFLPPLGTFLGLSISVKSSVSVCVCVFRHMSMTRLGAGLETDGLDFNQLVMGNH